MKKTLFLSAGLVLLCAFLWREASMPQTSSLFSGIQQVRQALSPQSVESHFNSMVQASIAKAHLY